MSRTKTVARQSSRDIQIRINDTEARARRLEQEKTQALPQHQAAIQQQADALRAQLPAQKSAFAEVACRELEELRKEVLPAIESAEKRAEVARIVVEEARAKYADACNAVDAAMNEAAILRDRLWKAGEAAKRYKE